MPGQVTRVRSKPIRAQRQTQSERLRDLRSGTELYSQQLAGISVALRIAQPFRRYYRSTLVDCFSMKAAETAITP